MRRLVRKDHYNFTIFRCIFHNHLTCFSLLVDTSHYNDFINNNDLHNIVRVTQSTPDRRKDDDDDDDDDNDFPNMVPSSDALLPPDYSRRVVSDQAAQAIRPSRMRTSEDMVSMILSIEIILKNLTTSYSPPCLLFFIFVPMILAI